MHVGAVPIKLLMTESEFESTAAVEMSAFHRLALEKGRNPRAGVLASPSADRSAEPVPPPDPPIRRAEPPRLNLHPGVRAVPGYSYEQQGESRNAGVAEHFQEKRGAWLIHSFDCVQPERGR